MMAYDIQLAERVRGALAKVGSVEERTMFGSLGFMLNGKLAVCVREHAVICKIGFERAAEAVHSGEAEPVFMGGREMKGWVLVRDERLQGSSLKKWLDCALTHGSLH